MFPGSEAQRTAGGCGLPGHHVRIDGRLDRDAVGAVCERLRRSGHVRTALLSCDVAGAVADLGTIDALAHLLVQVRRLGDELRLDGADELLTELAALVGLGDVLPLAPSPVEARGEVEQREQPLGVEEEHDAPNLALGDVEDLQ